MVEEFNDEKLDPHYLGYVHCFNKQLFYEAHEVLEHLWFKDRYGPNGAFYKGLIQLAGAFVHLQRDHLRPAAALLKLTLANLEKYPHLHERLNLDATRKLARKWLEDLEQTRFEANPLTSKTAPELKLERSRHE